MAARDRKWFAGVMGAAGAAALVLASAPAASAATVPGTLTLQGGDLSMTAPATVSFSATLAGVDQVANATQAVNVNDQRGTGAGWNLTLTTTQFTTGTFTLPTNALSEASTAGACAPSVTCTPADNTTVNYPLAIPAAAGAAPAAVTIVAAGTSTGLGQQIWTNQMRLAIPASVHAGTYTSTWTYSLTSGP